MGAPIAIGHQVAPRYKRAKEGLCVFNDRRKNHRRNRQNEPPKPEATVRAEAGEIATESPDGAAALIVEVMPASPEFSCEPRSENPPANDVPP